MNKAKIQGQWVEEDRLHSFHGMVPVDQFLEQGTGLILDQAEGIKVRDITGREYIDGLAGLACVNIGYSRPEMAQVAWDQMRKMSYMFSCYGQTSTAAIEYCSQLAAFLPPGLERTFLANSGSEAIEASFKLARYYWANQEQESKYKIISRHMSYHGLNMSPAWATGITKYQRKIGPPMPDFIKIPACYCYRCPLDQDYPSCKLACALALAETIEREGAETIAAFITEPILGTSGLIVPPPEYLPKIREICDEYGVLLILDEILTGFGRTGKNFACQHYGVLPDLMCISKGMSSSYFPISGAAISDKFLEGLRGDDYFPYLHTCGGHPVGAAVAKKNLEIIIEEKLVENSAMMGAYMMEKLKSLENNPHIGQIESLGLLFGLEMVEDKKTKEPLAPNEMERLEQAVINRGVIVRFFGSRLQFCPPLTVNENDLDQIFEAVEASVAEL